MQSQDQALAKSTQRHPALSLTPKLHYFHDMVIKMVREDTRDLTLRQITILLVCEASQEKSLTVRAVAKHLRIGKPAVTRAVDRLEKLQLLRRVPDPADKRSVLLAVTVAGRAFGSELCF